MLSTGAYRAVSDLRSDGLNPNNIGILEYTPTLSKILNLKFRIDYRHLKIWVSALYFHSVAVEY